MDSHAGGIHLLYDFKYTIPGGKKDPVLVKAGEQYRLIEKKTDRWLAVSRLDRNDVLYVPTSYTQEIQHKLPQTNDNKVPPRLPVKPKNLFDKMQKNLKVEPPSPPPIDEDAHIELYNILSGNIHKLPLPTEHKLTSHGETFDGNKTSDHPQDDPNKNRLSQNVYTDDVDETNKNEDYQKPSLHEQFDDINAPQPVTINGYEVYKDEATGKQYYYNPKTKTSSWTLPQNFEDQSNFYANLDEDSSDILHEKSNYTHDEFHIDKETANNLIVNSFDSSSDDPENQTTPKLGPINRLKLSENDRKLKKNWTQSIMMLDGSNLYFFKDRKSTTNKSKSEVTIDLTSSFVVRGGTSNRQNLIQVITSSGTEYLLQSDDQGTINDWFQSLSNATTFKPTDPGDTMFFSSKSDDNNNVFKTKKNGNLGSYQDLSSKAPASPSVVSLTNASSSTTNTLEKSKFKERLKLWILKRPTKETLREKGIYKDGIFGSTLSIICEKEGTEVPLFVTHCIEAVEERGLSVDGIYRANGNMAEIQKLRFAVNTNGSQSLLSSSFSSPSSLADIHVITGALKLFFRELQEPLFPYHHFNLIMNVFNSKSKAQAIKSILATLPQINYQTLAALLQHLLIVVSHSSENRMHVHNLSIVFGPTLMWPKESSDQNLAVSMVMRSQLVEMLLQDYSFYFDSRA